MCLLISFKLCIEAEGHINVSLVGAVDSKSFGLVAPQPAEQPRGSRSTQRSRNDHSSWLAGKQQGTLRHVGMLLCSVLSLGG